MEKRKIIGLLAAVKARRLSVDDAFEKLKHLPFEDLGFAKVDHHRRIRSGLPEVVFCQGKTLAQIIGIFCSLRKKNKTVLLTKANGKIFAELKRFEEKVIFNSSAGVIYFCAKKSKGRGKIAVVCAGTADIPFAEEAALTAEVFGNSVERVYDVGVAGIHRLFAQRKKIQSSRCVIVLAGMEGALASVIGGLVDCPVIAVPTSIGYGASFKGVTALLTMINSCSPNISVVNINNGFGAGYIASLINRS